MINLAEYIHEKFPTSKMVVRTVHVEDDDGRRANVFNLPPERLSQRQVVHLDLALDGITPDKPKHRNPQLVKSEKTHRGPLRRGWVKSLKGEGHPVMCAYKLIDCTFDSYLLWAASGSFAGYVKDLMLDFNQYVYCLMDQWYGLTIEDIRAIEAEFRDEADRIVKYAGIEEREKTPSSTKSA